jgi:ribosomal protein S18 acetylase RimI-like enzyme
VLTIRRANSDDAASIAEIHVATWRAAYRGQMPDEILDKLDHSQRTCFWREVLSSEHDVCVATVDSTIAGFCSLIPSRDSDDDPAKVAEIAALYVSAQNWRRGIGRSLCRHGLSIAAGCRYAAVTLWVLATNKSAIRFYEAIGFAPDGATKSELDPTGFNFSEIRMRIASSGMNRSV